MEGNPHGKKIDSCHFEYPGSTHAIRCRGESGHVPHSEHGRGSAQRQAFPEGHRLQQRGGTGKFLYKQTYYRPEDFDDSRYDPFLLTPCLSRPDRASQRHALPCGNGMTCDVRSMRRMGATGELIRGEKDCLRREKWYDLPCSCRTIWTVISARPALSSAGVAGGFASSDLTVYLDELYYDGAPCYRIDFSKTAVEDWGHLHLEIAQFGKLKGHSYLDGSYLSLSCGDFAEMYTGGYHWKDYSLSCVLKPLTGEEHFLNVRVQGRHAFLCGRLYRQKAGSA